MKNRKVFSWDPGRSKLYFTELAFPFKVDEEAMWYGDKVKKWPSETIAILSDESKLPATDVVSYGGPFKLISDTFKQLLLDEIDSSHIQILPIKEVRTLNRSIVLTNYWLLNVVKRVDCVDWSKIRNSPDEERPGERYRDEPGPLTLFSEAIPPEVKLFKPKGDSLEILLISDLVAKIKKQFPNHGSKFGEQIMSF